MIRRLTFALALLVGACATPADKSPNGIGLENYGSPAPSQQAKIDIQRVVSPGGIEAWLVTEPNVPIIVLKTYWKGGAAAESDSLLGVSGVLADMMTEGAGPYDEAAFKERLEQLNMQLGFSAGWDGMSMELTTLSRNRDAAFDMARLALQAPRFEAAPLDRIKRQAQVALRQQETSPAYIANRTLDAAIIPGHPYARRPNAATVARIARANLAERQRALFVRNRMIITVVGDIDAAALAPLLDKTFGALPVGAAAPAVADIAPKAGPALLIKPLEQPQSLILFAAPGVKPEDPDWMALAVANYIIGGGGFSSRLMNEVREKSGLVYGVSTAPYALDHAGFVRGSAQTSNATVNQATEMIRAEFRRFHDQGATEDEVRDAKLYLTGSFPLSFDSDSKIADTIQSYRIQGRDIDYINRRNGMLEAVTKADVDRVAKRLFDANAFTFVVVGQPTPPEAKAPEANAAEAKSATP